MRSRSYRRAASDKAKARAKILVRLWRKHLTPKNVGMAARTRVPCSCWMCGNRRQSEGETMQERRQTCWLDAP